MNHKKIKNQMGYTLIEVLVVLMLSSLLAVTGLVLLKDTTGLWVKQNARLWQADETVMVQQYIRKILEGAVKGEGTRTFTFLGRNRELDFFTHTAGFNEPPSRVRIYLRPKNKTLSEPELIAECVNCKKPDAVKLLHNLKDVHFQYFGIQPPDNTSVWHDNWENQEVLPELVKLDVEFSDQTGAIWPLFIVEMTLSGTLE